MDRANVDNEYTYDANGNLKKDLNRNISLITYNELNLPNVITFADGNTVTYGYDAAGSKLSVAYQTGGTTTKTEYAGNKVYNNGTLSMILTEEGYATLSGTTPAYHYYLKDHQGNNRVVINQSGTVLQVNHYYPFGGLFGEGVQTVNQRYRYNGKELDRELGLDMYDYGARHYDAALGRWFTVDPLAEKYYSISPYVYVANNPVRFIDLRGDSLTLVGDRIQETLLALYNGLEKGTAITMNFNNGVLDPTSIEYQAKNTNDVFLQDIYEIAINPTMVELSTSNKNTYIMNGQELEDKFNAPYDYDTKIDPHAEGILKMMGEPIGYSIHGNLGQTLIPGKVSASGKSSKSSNVEVIINGKGSIRQRTVGLAHEFGHVILYFRGLPYGHRQPGVDDFVYGRATMMSKRLGYDF